MRYHPRIGFTYMPSAKLRVQGTNGGYLVRTNAAGFRSDREFVHERTPGAFRVALYGDSQAAGDGLANSLRFSDLVEKAIPGLEIYNYALSGTGTDQQYLAYGENRSVGHDLLVIAMYVENIRRVSTRIIKSSDANGQELFRSKPYYELVDDDLVLCNVPAPTQMWTEETLPPEQRPHVHVHGAEYATLRNSPRLRAASGMLSRSSPLRRAVKAALTSLKPLRPLPEYDDADTPEWQLLRKILLQWLAESPTPVLLVLLPHETALVGTSDPTNYQARFRELARDTGCHVYDPLVDLGDLPQEKRAGLWSYQYWHFSASGHETIARLLVPVVQKLMDDAAFPKSTRP